MRILNELYLGNINPNDKTFHKDSPYGRTCNLVNKAETYLNSVLGEEEKAVLAEFIEAYTALNLLTGEAAFEDGFKLGAQIMLSVLYGMDEEQIS